MVKDDLTSFLGAGTEYQGQLSFKGTVRLDCNFLGDITSDGKLILGKEADLKGTVRVKELVVHGTLNGEAIVANRTILHKDAKVAGTLSTTTLVMEEGATLQGELFMGNEVIKNKNAKIDATHQLSSQAEHGVQLLDASVKQ